MIGRDSNTITSLDDIDVGDEVAYQEGGAYHDRPLLRVKVTKVSTTQITVGSKRFLKRSGREVGGSTYHSAYIYPLGDRNRWGANGETWADRVKSSAVEWKETKRRNELFNYIRNLPRQKFYSLPLEQLEQAAKLLGFEVPVATEPQEEATQS